MSPRALVALLCLGILALAAAGATAALSSGAPAGSAPPAFDGALMPPNVWAPNFSLRDQYGRRFTMSQYRGRPVVVTFLYTHCKESCPAEAQQIKGAFDDIGHDLPAVAISVDPSQDSPASARAFLAEQGMSGRLRFALGTRSQLAPLWRGYAITPELPGQSEHMALIVLVDREGRQRVAYPQTETTPERLAHDLTLLEKS